MHKNLKSVLQLPFVDTFCVTIKPWATIEDLYTVWGGGGAVVKLVKLQVALEQHTLCETHEHGGVG
jgi:hypothetical protein